MSGKESGDRPLPITHEDVYRPIGENGLPAPKSVAERSVDREAVRRWKAQMAAAPYSGYP